MKRMGWVVLLLSALAGCQDSDPTPVVNVAAPSAPTGPVAPACQLDHLADVSFQNLGESFVDVLLDGIYIGTLPPEATGFEQNVAASVVHRLDWRTTNTMTFVCPESRPIPVECSKVIWPSCYGF